MLPVLLRSLVESRQVNVNVVELMQSSSLTLRQIRGEFDIFLLLIDWHDVFSEKTLERGNSLS
jgi:hypothetical protein